MSQPFDRGACIPAPKTPDSRLNDWWVENPWQIHKKGKSLSGHERNRVLLNQQGRRFWDISSLTGADSPGDGRSVVAFDFSGDGMQDVLVRQSGGGAVLVFENHFPKAHWLEVRLRGTRSNSQGIGARLTAVAGARTVVREIYPANGFKAQGPALAHFGLGQQQQVERLTVRWPSGLVQEFAAIDADQQILITEGKTEFEPGRK